MAIMKTAFVFTLFLIQSTLWGQILEAPWRDFLSVDSRLTAANELEREWLEQQHELSEEIRKLQQNQSWYNGWIVELRIARKSTLQVELADSLQQIRKRIADLEAQQNEAFLALREVYQQILLESESEDRLSRSQKEQVLAIGRQLLSQSNVTLELPDYTSILNSPYENEAIKHLVLEDLQAVLQRKLVLIDSLLTEKEAELTLLDRLNEFHRDLSYQMKSDLDPATPSTAGIQETPSQDEPEPVFFEGVEAEGVSYMGGRSSKASVGDNPTATINQSPVVSGETNISLNVEPTNEVINQLKNKRRQYQDLLKQIETQLPQ